MFVSAERLPQRSADARQVSRGLLQLLPAGQRRQVLRARLPDVRLGQQRKDRLQGVPAGDQHHVVGQAGAEARVGVPDVRRERRRNHRTQRDGRNYRSQYVMYNFCSPNNGSKKK